MSLDLEGIIGRERELNVIRSYIHSPRVFRVLVMWGPVGSGRSFILHHILRTEQDVIRVFLDLSPAPKPLRLPGVLEMEKCRGESSECIDMSVREGLARGDGTQARIVVAVDGVACERSGPECRLPLLIRSLARLVETYSDRLRILISIDDLEAALLLGSVAEYIEPLVVAGLPPDAARELVKREARRAGLSLSDEIVNNIVSVTGGLPYEILVLIHEYKGDVERWSRDIAFKVRWKLSLISIETGVPVRDAAKAILDMHGRQVITLPKSTCSLLRAALRTNLVYVDEHSIVRLQLPIYRGIIHSIAYGGPFTGP